MFIAEMTIDGDPPDSWHYSHDEESGEISRYRVMPSPFTKSVKFRFDEHVNVFIGPNSSGKSSALQQVLDNYRREWAGGGAQCTSEPEPGYVGKQFVRLTKSEHCVFALENHDADDDTGTFDVIIVPTTRVRYGAAPVKDGSIVDDEGRDFFGVETLSEVLYQDHIHSTISALQRTIQGNQIEDDAIPEGRQLADYQLLGLAEEAAKQDPIGAGDGLNQALSVAHQCAKSICREVVTGDIPQHDRIVREIESESGLPEAEVHFELGIRIQTNDTRDGRRVDPLSMTSLSSGTESTLWWTRLIALSLLFMHGFEPGWQERRAILVIDEIENHLHPTWQRRIIPALLEHFPGLQIFATTHSPFVVAGLKAGQVHMLKRDAKGVVTATTNEHDIIGWTTDEILRTFMGVDEPTDQLTVNRRERLLELRRKDPLTDEEAVEIEKLRRQVNEDFLSSSTPLEAQRERYGDMMLEFLRSRQSELSQDGS